MSQSGLLNEDEIKNYFNEAFGLRLDRDSLIKPTKDVVFDIYTKCLDGIYPQWRKSSSSSLVEIHIRLTIVKFVRLMLSPYDTSYTFQLTDLLMPDRKRTVAFLNILIYINEQIRERLKAVPEREEEFKLNQKEHLDIDKSLANKKIELERLALQRGTSETIEELLDETKKKTTLFKELEREVEDWGERGASIKNKIESRKILLKERELEASSRRKELEREEENLRLLDIGRGSKKRISDKKKQVPKLEAQKLEMLKERSQVVEKNKNIDKLLIKLQKANADRDKNMSFAIKLAGDLKKDTEVIKDRLEKAEDAFTKSQEEASQRQNDSSNMNKIKSKKKIQHRMKEEQLLKDLKMKQETRMDSISLQRCKVDQLEKEVLVLDEEITKSTTLRELSSKQREIVEERANKQLESMIKHALGSNKVSEEAIAKSLYYKTKLELIFNGKPTEIDRTIQADRTIQVDRTIQADRTIPADRTYIKESAPNKL